MSPIELNRILVSERGENSCDSVLVHWLRNTKASAAMHLNTTGWNMESTEVLI